MTIICTRLAIFSTFWPFFLLEPFGLYLSVLHVERMRLFHPFEKMVKVLLPEKGPKIEKIAILSVMLAILGYFSMFSPNDHTDICLSEQQDCTESTLLLYILRDISILRLNILKTRENGHNMHQNGHIWYFLAIFVAGTFQPLCERAACGRNALVSPI